MKLKILAILLLGTTIANVTLANEKPEGSYQSVVKAFMHSYLNNDHKKLKTLLSEDAEYSFNRDVRVVKHSASAIINEMKRNEGVKQQGCNISSKIITATDALVMAQVDISYAAFDGKQKNYLVLERNKEGEWKITNVYKLFVSSKGETEEKKDIAV